MDIPLLLTVVDNEACLSDVLGKSFSCLCVIFVGDTAMSSAKQGLPDVQTGSTESLDV